MRNLKNLLFIIFAFFGHFLLFFGGILATKLLAIGLWALFGWFIGLFVGNTILGILAQIGISGYDMWQIGTFIGFIASFFTSPIRINDLRTKKV